MESCDDCPGSVSCAGLNLHPILVQVFELYRSGTTDKFDILFALGDEGEALLERYDQQLSHACWTKSALLAIVDVIGRDAQGGDERDPEAQLSATLYTARDAFQRFPWRLDALVEHAPTLYSLINEQHPDSELSANLSKRAFVKICKEIAFG